MPDVSPEPTYVLRGALLAGPGQREPNDVAVSRAEDWVTSTDWSTTVKTPEMSSDAKLLPITPDELITDRISP